MRLDAEELLGELGWLRRLARSLVGPAGVEEDLVQETWMAGARVEGGVSRAWLVGTLRKLAARWHRRESRLRRRESAAARPEALDGDSLVERNELFSLVLSELRALDEPFRTTLLLLHQEGLSAREAAERLAIPVDTLRWRRREGLARLRRRLDVSGEAGCDWRAAFLPLLGLPSTNPTAGAASAGATAGTLFHVGGFLMTWKLTTAALVAALALLYVLFGVGRDEQRDPHSHAAVERGPVAALDAPAAVTRRAAPVADEEPTATGTRVPAAQPPEAEEPPSKGPRLAVQVIDEARAPVAGARIWIGEAPDPVEASWVTDARGVATLPMPEAIVQISGMTDTLYGEAPLIPKLSGGELLLQLFQDGDVAVLIVDEQGTPIPGVPVGVIGKNLEKHSLHFSDVTETDAHGEVLLRHILAHFVFAREGFEVQVGPAVLLRRRSDVSLTRSALPTEALRITLPPTGALTVRVLTASGEPNLSAPELRLVVDPNPAATRETNVLAEALRFSPLGVLKPELEAGVAEIPFIGLGLELIGQARKADPTDTAFGAASGPRKAGASAELVLRPRELPTEVVGLARDTHGAGLARRELEGWLLLAGEVWHRDYVVRATTDASGRFRVLVDEDMLREWPKASRRSLRLGTRGPRPLEWIQAEFALPEQLVRGPHDLGVARFDLRPPLVQGHAVDARGEAVPIDQAWMSVQARNDPGHARAVFTQRALFDGNAFAIYAPLQELDAGRDEVLVVAGKAQGHPSARVEGLPGARDLLLLFGEAGSVAGTLLTDPGDSPAGYWVRFFTTDAAGVRRAQATEQVALNGSFLLDGLPREHGDVEIQDIASGTAVATIRGVLPVAAPAPQDRRLDSIDVRSTLHEFRLSVVDEEGGAIAGANFESPALRDSTTAYAREPLSLRSEAQSIEGEVHAPGFRTLAVVLLPGDQSVTLRRGPEVLVRPEPIADLPRGAELRVVLVALDHDDRVELVPRPDGAHSGHVSGPGEYAVRGLLRRQGVLLAELPLSKEAGSRVLVSDRASVQEFELPLDTAAFEQRIPAQPRDR